MNCSTDKNIFFWSFLGRDFIYMWEKFQHCQSSNSSYLQKYPVFSATNVPLLFFCLDICIFTSVQTKKLHLVEKWVKSSHLLFIIFSLSNCNYSSIVHWRSCRRPDKAPDGRLRRSRQTGKTSKSVILKTMILQIFFFKICMLKRFLLAEEHKNSHAVKVHNMKDLQ